MGMIVFPRLLHEAIKSGKVALAFRLWETCRLVSGKTYGLENLGRILIQSAEKIPVSSITEGDAHLAGFPDLGALMAQFKSSNPHFDPTKDTCYRIAFRYMGNGRPWSDGMPQRPLSQRMLGRLDETLKRMDRRAQGITYSAILKEISRQPFHRVGTLAGHFDCQPTEIRRKLFRLMKEQLVVADGSRCYSLTPRARQLLSHCEAIMAELKK